MGLWGIVETAAAAEFGRRHYRGIIAARIARNVAGPVAAAVVVMASGYTAVRWGVPALTAAGRVAARWSINIVPAAIVVGLVLVVVPAGLLAWRRWGWRVSLYHPLVTGRAVAAAFAVVLALAAAAAVWPS